MHSVSCTDNIILFISYSYSDTSNKLIDYRRFSSFRSSQATVTESVALRLMSVVMYLYFFDGHVAVFHGGGFILQWEG